MWRAELNPRTSLGIPGLLRPLSGHVGWAIRSQARLVPRADTATPGTNLKTLLRLLKHGPQLPQKTRVRVQKDGVGGRMLGGRPGLPATGRSGKAALRSRPLCGENPHTEPRGPESVQGTRWDRTRGRNKHMRGRVWRGLSSAAHPRPRRRMALLPQACPALCPGEPLASCPDGNARNGPGRAGRPWGV